MKNYISKCFLTNLGTKNSFKTLIIERQDIQWYIGIEISLLD